MAKKVENTSKTSIVKVYSTMDKYLKIINKYGLKPGLKRDLSLFTSSCIGLSYTTLLKETFGIKYNAFGAISQHGGYLSFVNLSFVANEAQKIIKKEDYLWEKIVPKAEKIFNSTTKEAKACVANKNINVEKKLNELINIIPVHYTVVGLVNAIMRYFNDGEVAKNYSEKFLKKIGGLRNNLASRYPWFEKIFLECAEQYEKENGIPRNTLKYLIISELKHLLKHKKSFQKFIRISKIRQKAYFHYFVPGFVGEGVITDEKVIERIIREFKINNNGIKADVIKGFSAFRGCVTGFVLKNLSAYNKNNKKMVLVMPMTHPKDILLMEKSIAIITDEGGILSHAAIISRELKKPCIIGTKIATQVLKDGDLVEVDADNGIVRILNR